MTATIHHWWWRPRSPTMYHSLNNVTANLPFCKRLVAQNLEMSSDQARACGREFYKWSLKRFKDLSFLIKNKIWSIKVPARRVTVIIVLFLPKHVVRNDNQSSTSAILRYFTLKEKKNVANTTRSSDHDFGVSHYFGRCILKFYREFVKITVLSDLSLLRSKEM